MRLKITLRKFFFTHLLITFAVTTLLAGIGAYYFTNRRIQNHLDEVLIELGVIFKNSTSLEKLTPQALQKVQSQAQQKVLTSDATPHNIRQLYRYQFQLWDQKGKLIKHSELIKNMPFSGSLGLIDQDFAGTRWRVFTLFDEQRALNFVVTENYKFRRSLIQSIIIDNFYLTLLAYSTVGLSVWLILGRGLKQMECLASSIAHRLADNLEPVDLQAVPVEIMPLIDRLNKLFLQLKEAYDREQRFAADAAHELHTPLAALRTQTQVALKTVNSKERFLQLQNIISSVDRCTHIIQQLLVLCRLSPETIISDHFSQLDLKHLVTEIVAQLAPKAIDKNIDIEFISESEKCLFWGNATSLYAMARNLIENAIHYTFAGGTIKILLKYQSDNILFQIIDSGPGIPESLRERVFERFYRALGAHVQGTGLGLAIVKETVKHHKGTINLATPPNGKGLSVTVLLPYEIN